jgi:alkylated DNA repair dioxygenase AlkB
LFAKIVDEVPWHAERRQMYDRVVDVPRLLSFYVLDAARTTLSRQYDEDLREPFPTAGLCYYRDGRDSVA